MKMFRTIAKLPIHIYRTIISPLLPTSCRFTPTCSQYTLDAIDHHGALKGIILGLWRIMRCNPWNKQCAHNDPVPTRFTLFKD